MQLPLRPHFSPIHNHSTPIYLPTYICIYVCTYYNWLLLISFEQLKLLTGVCLKCIGFVNISKACLLLYDKFNILKDDIIIQRIASGMLLLLFQDHESTEIGLSSSFINDLPTDRPPRRNDELLRTRSVPHLIHNFRSSFVIVWRKAYSTASRRGGLFFSRTWTAGRLAGRSLLWLLRFASPKSPLIDTPLVCISLLKVIVYVLRMTLLRHWGALTELYSVWNLLWELP